MDNEKAVSPVIGVILMVAITIIIAAVVAVFGFGFADFAPKGPTASIVYSNIPETYGIYDLKIAHKAGDNLKAGDWRISIVKVGDPPAYVIGTTDFRAGDMIITRNLTNKGTVTVTNSAITVVGDASVFAPETKYEIKIIVYPFQTLVADAVVLVR